MASPLHRFLNYGVGDTLHDVGRGYHALTSPDPGANDVANYNAAMLQMGHPEAMIAVDQSSGGFGDQLSQLLAQFDPRTPEGLSFLASIFLARRPGMEQPRLSGEQQNLLTDILMAAEKGDRGTLNPLTARDRLMQAQMDEQSAYWRALDANQTGNSDLPMWTPNPVIKAQERVRTAQATAVKLPKMVKSAKPSRAHTQVIRAIHRSAKPGKN